MEARRWGPRSRGKVHERRRTQASEEGMCLRGVWGTMHLIPPTAALLSSVYTVYLCTSFMSLALVTDAPTFALAHVAPKTERRSTSLKPYPCEQASAALCVIYVGEDEWRWCWPRQECYVMLANLEGTGEFILLADQDLTDVADLSDALRSSKSGSDEAEQNQWIATLELCFHFAVAPRFILAAGPHSVAALSATCMFECDVLNGLVSCSVGLSTTCDPHARAGSRGYPTLSTSTPQHTSEQEEQQQQNQNKKNKKNKSHKSHKTHKTKQTTKTTKNWKN